MKITEPTTFSVRPVTPAGQPEARPGKEQPTWRPGQILQASVASVRDGQVILNLNGRSFAAQSQLGLQEGQPLLLHVAATSPQILLQTLGLNPETQQNPLLQLLNAGWDLPSLLRQIQTRKGASASWLDTLREALKDFMANMEEASGKMDGATLAALLNDLGVARLLPDETPATLRQALADLLSQDADSDPLSPKLLEGLKENLDTVARLNLQLQQEGAMVLPLPLPFLQQGFLIMENAGNPEDETSSGTQKISLHLELENLGELRVDMLWEDRELRIRFTCAKGEASRALSASDDELKSALQETSLREIVFSTGAVRPEQGLAKHLAVPPSGFVNTRI